VLQRFNIDACTLRHETTEAALGLKNLPKFARSQVQHHAGGLDAAIRYYADNPSADIIIVEDDGDVEVLNSRIDALAQVVEPGRKLIVIGSVNDIGVYRRMLSMGVADYLLSPCTIDDLAAAIDHATHDPQGPAQGKVFAFIGARGGVGSSTVAQNTAWSLAIHENLQTALVDLDLTFGTAALAFNEEVRQPLSEALADPDRLDQVLLQRFMTGENEKLQILSTNGALRNSLPPSHAAIEKLLDLCRHMADVIVLDIPHAWSPWIEDMLLLADEVILVISPDLANLRDAKNILDLLRTKRGDGREPKLIVNKVDLAKRSRLTAQDINKTLAIQPFATISSDPLTFIESVNDGKMIGEKAKSHKAAVAFRQIAANLTRRPTTGRRRSLGLPALFKRPANPAKA